MLDVTGKATKILTVELIGEGTGNRKLTTVEGQLFEGSMQVGEFSVTLDGELVNRQGSNVQIVINNQPEMMQRHITEMEAAGEEVPEEMRQMCQSGSGELNTNELKVTEMTTSSKEIA
jgi:hypothetical protein